MKNFTIKLFVLLWVIFSVNSFAQKSKNNPKSAAGQIIVVNFQKDLDSIFNDPNFSNAIWGVVIQSLETGEYIYRRNENISLMPASNMKIFTTATALAMLGPDYRYTTNLLTNGKIEGDVIKGDLIIKGSGDPTFPRKNPKDTLSLLFSSWIDSLKNIGVKKIQGDIIGDNSCFDNQGLGVGWAWDDETYGYSAPSSGLCYNNNCVNVSVSPGKYVGSSAEIKTNPNTKYISLNNKIITVPKDTSTDIDYYRKSGTNIIDAFGVISLGRRTINESISINNPALYVATVLKEMLEAVGISVTGSAMDIENVSPKEKITTIYQKLNSAISAPLSEIIKLINKNSQNLYAEQLLRTLGKEFDGFGSIEESIEIEKNFLSEIGIDHEKIKIVDGSGLSRLNLVTPMYVLALLKYMYGHQFWNEFYNSLPIAGVDGTLSGRMKGSEAANNVHAKTGFIGYVRGLSGYVKSKDGEMFVFSMIANNYTVPTSLANNIQDSVCIRLANFTRTHER
jgi:D-alanyl-D-alanine carboxypeptidase/D-alanyl-D-alanine-endopeptidase (penicillin-binding protein 4)